MNRITGMKTCLMAAASLALVAVAGCDKPNSAETAGKKIDQTMEKVGQKVDQATERAKEQVAKTTERAKEQVAKTGQALDDTAITAAVKAGILAEPGLKVLKIDVDTKDGQVTLTGSADSGESVQRATQVASTVQGVKSVDNRLAVSSKG